MAALGDFFNGKARRLRRAGAILALLRPLSSNRGTDRDPGSTLDQVLNELENIGCLGALTPNGRADQGASSRSVFETEHTLKIILRAEADPSTYASSTLRKDYLSVTRVDQDRWTWCLGSTHYCDFSQAAAEQIGLMSQ